MRLPTLFQRNKSLNFAAKSAKGSLFNLSGDQLGGLMNALSNVQDPDTVLQKVGLKRKDLKRLETDEEIYAALETRLAAVVTVPWRLDPQDGTPEEACDFIEAVLAPHVETLIHGAWQAVPYGYSVVELIYQKLDAGHIGLAAPMLEPMEWFEPQPDGTLCIAHTGDKTPLDQEFKFLLTRRLATWQNPFGEALLSRLYWPWYFRHNAWRFWMQFLERFGNPLLIGKADDPEDLSNKLVQIGSEMHVVVHTDEDLAAVTSSNAAEFEKVEQALVKRVQKLILGQTLTTDVGSSGSYSAAKVHNDVREDRRNSDLRLVCEAINKVVKALWTLNGFAGTAPLFVMEDGQGIGAERAARDATLVQAGIVRLSEDYLLRTYDFVAGDFEIPEPRSNMPFLQQSAPRIGQAARFAATLEAKPKYTKNQMDVEAVGDKATQSTSEREQGLIQSQHIQAAIAAAQSAEDLAERLALLLAEADSDTYSAALEQALFVAESIGYAQAIRQPKEG